MIRKTASITCAVILLSLTNAFASEANEQDETDAFNDMLINIFARRTAEAIRPVVVPALIEEYSIPTVNYIILLNYYNPIPKDYFNIIELVEVENGHKLEKNAAKALNLMLAAAREEGLNPVLRSSFRTAAEQKYLFNRQITRQRGYGLDSEAAFEAARRVNAYPGTSEHEAGLAVDIVASSYQTLDSKQETTKEAKWLMENCHKYGFILRYPKDKTQITEIIYEPWHYRYVGVEAAAQMRELGLCLEEYHVELKNVK